MKLCPYCDHPVNGPGKCPTCGARVWKVVTINSAAKMNVGPTANPGECDCDIHMPELHQHDDTYRDSEDRSFRSDYEEAYGDPKPVIPPNLQPHNNVPNRSIPTGVGTPFGTQFGAGSTGNAGQKKSSKPAVLIMFIWIVFMMLMSFLSALD